jgi:hypothetical protein
VPEQLLACQEELTSMEPVTFLVNSAFKIRQGYMHNTEIQAHSLIYFRQFL